jgi:hypothetical protein
MFCDLDLVAGGDLVQKSEKSGLCFRSGHLTSHMVSIVVISGRPHKADETRQACPRATLGSSDVIDGLCPG